MKKLIAPLVFLCLWGLCLKWSQPTVSFGDSGELITAAAKLGVAHAPGQPLYLLLAHLGKMWPLGEIAWRINLVSAGAGGLALTLFYCWLSLDTPVILSLGAVGGAFFFQPFLEQCLWSEVYTLVLCFWLGYLYLWQEPKSGALAMLLLGLGLVTHYMTALLLPVFLLGLLIYQPARSLKQLSKGFLALLLPTSLFLYLPLRAIKHPYLNWGAPWDLRGFLYHVLIKQRGGALSGSGTNQITQLKTLNALILGQFHWAAVLLVVVLAASLFIHKYRRQNLFLLLLFCWAYLTNGWFLKFNSLELLSLQAPKFFILNYLLGTYLLYRAFLWGDAYFGKNKFRQGGRLFFGLLLFCLIHPGFWPQLQNLRKTAHYFYATDYVQNLLNLSGQRDTIYFADDSFGFPALYELAIKERKPGAKLVHLGNVFTSWGVENLWWNYPDLRLSYLKNQKPPYSVYQLGPKFIRELIVEKGRRYQLIAPFTLTDLPTGYQNYQLLLGYGIAVQPPRLPIIRLRTRGFQRQDFLADPWTNSLAGVYFSAAALSLSRS